MATAVQLSQGNEFARSSEGGRTVDSATRVYKVLLDSPGEAWDIPATIGVGIGDQYSDDNPIPCVSFEARADGESRLVRIVTVRYRASPGFASDGVSDPRTEAPAQRPAVWSMSTSLQEIAAWAGLAKTGGSWAWSPSTNPAGDIVDGITRLEPVVTINIDQYSQLDGSSFMGYVGFVNSDTCTFSSLTMLPHCCMLQGISSTPVVEQFKFGMFRGFKITFSFGVRSHWTLTRYGTEPIGWDIAVPQAGHNIINTGFGSSDVDEDTLNLEHADYTTKVLEPRQLASGTSGKKVRAAVLISNPGGPGAYQRPATMPVPLNDNGSPRSRTADPKVLINRICLQPEMAFGTNFSAFGIRYTQL
jgi:hypothetical protein